MNKKTLQSKKELTAICPITGDVFHANGTKKELYKALRQNQWYDKMYKRMMESEQPCNISYDDMMRETYC